MVGHAQRTRPTGAGRDAREAEGHERPRGARGRGTHQQRSGEDSGTRCSRRWTGAVRSAAGPRGRRHRHHRRRGARCARPEDLPAAARRCMCCSTGAPNERDRKLTVVRAARFGIVGQDAEIELRVDDFGRPHAAATPTSLCASTARTRARASCRSGTRDHDHRAGRAWRRERGRARGGAGPGRADAAEQPRRGGGHRRARPAARAAGFRRAACGRARVAQPVEGRPVASIWCISPFCARPTSRTARRSTNCR